MAPGTRSGFRLRGGLDAMGSTLRGIVLAGCLCLGQLPSRTGVTPVAPGDDKGGPQARGADVNARTLHKKVLCGYQGWFRCPGDAAEKGWVHWSRDAIRIAPDTLSFEMWPDLSEFSSAEKYPAPGFTHRDGKTAF